jgi:long-chain acyl-CoA synthetase
MTYPKINLPEMLERTSARLPGAPALIYFGAKISYGQLQDHVNRLAAGLHALGIAKGDRVALMMPNCPQFVISYFGVLRAGAIITATSTMYTAREVTHQWNDAGAKIVIADRRLHHVIKAAIPQLTSVRHIILTGMRQYSASQFPRICELLKSSSRARGSANRKSSASGTTQAKGPALHLGTNS